MWTRSELKEKAKAYVKRSYWPLVLVSLILAVITGGFSNGGNSGRDYSTDWSGGVDGGDIASRITGSITGIDWALVGGIMAIAAVFAVAVIAIAVIVSIFVLNPIEVGCRRYFIEAAYGEVTMKNSILYARPMRTEIRIRSGLTRIITNSPKKPMSRLTGARPMLPLWDSRYPSSLF